MADIEKIKFEIGQETHTLKSLTSDLHKRSLDPQQRPYLLDSIGDLWGSLGVLRELVVDLNEEGWRATEAAE